MKGFLVYKGWFSRHGCCCCCQLLFEFSYRDVSSTIIRVVTRFVWCVLSPSVPVHITILHGIVILLMRGALWIVLSALKCSTNFLVVCFIYHGGQPGTVVSVSDSWWWLVIRWLRVRSDIRYVWDCIDYLKALTKENSTFSITINYSCKYFALRGCNGTHVDKSVSLNKDSM